MFIRAPAILSHGPAVEVLAEYVVPDGKTVADTQVSTVAVAVRQGQLLGTAFQGLGGRGLCLVPAVCLGSNTSGKPTSVELVEFNLAWLGPRF